MICLQSLSTILLNNCGHVTTNGILTLLRNLNLLERIEANNGQDSTVQQAIDILDTEHSENFKLKQNKREPKASNLILFPNMKDFVFRNPRTGLAMVSRFCPNLLKVDIAKITE